MSDIESIDDLTLISSSKHSTTNYVQQSNNYDRYYFENLEQRIAILEEGIEVRDEELMRLNLDFKTVIAEVSLVVEWVKDTFDSDIINKQSRIYNNLHDFNEIDELKQKLRSSTRSSENQDFEDQGDVSITFPEQAPESNDTDNDSVLIPEDTEVTDTRWISDQVVSDETDDRITNFTKRSSNFEDDEHEIEIIGNNNASNSSQSQAQCSETIVNYSMSVIPSLVHGEPVIATSNIQREREERQSRRNQQPVPRFLAKLWEIVKNPSSNHLIHWNPDGNDFSFYNSLEFTRSLLPLHFKHSNMSSFVRQLNLYGFHKQIETVEDQFKSTFAHRHFLRGRRDLLHLIKRKKTQSEEMGSSDSFLSSISSDPLLLEAQVQSPVRNSRHNSNYFDEGLKNDDPDWASSPCKKKTHKKFRRFTSSSSYISVENLHCSDSSELAPSTSASPNSAKLFSCKYCNLKFASIQTMQSHRKTLHKLRRPVSVRPNSDFTNLIVCSICGEVFDSPANLTSHKNIVHNRPIYCPILFRLFALQKSPANTPPLPHSGDSNTSNITREIPTAFLNKLWSMVDDPDISHIISWDETGDGFLIHDEHQLCTTLLPFHFKHGNLASFIRQLNMYGFRKESSRDLEDNMTESNDPPIAHFVHPSFRRGRKDLLQFVARSYHR